LIPPPSPPISPLSLHDALPISPRHVDVTEDLEIPGLAPARLVDLGDVAARDRAGVVDQEIGVGAFGGELVDIAAVAQIERVIAQDRKSTRLNSSHVSISYAVFC